MKTSFKRLTALLLALVLTLSLLSAAAIAADVPGYAHLRIGAVSGQPGDIVKVPVYLEGLKEGEQSRGFDASITLGENLTLEGAEWTKLTNIFTYKVCNKATGYLTVTDVMDAGIRISENGKVCDLLVKIADDATSVGALTLSGLGIYGRTSTEILNSTDATDAGRDYNAVVTPVDENGDPAPVISLATQATYKIVAEADKTEVTAGDTVNVTVKVEGGDVIGAVATLSYESDKFDLTAAPSDWSKTSTGYTILAAAGAGQTLNTTLGVFTFTAKAQTTDDVVGSFTLSNTQCTSDRNNGSGNTSMACEVQNASVTIKLKTDLDVTATNKEVTYNGDPQSFNAVTSTTSGAVVKYGKTAGTYDITDLTDADETEASDAPYTLYYEVTAPGYAPKTGSITLTINRAEIKYTATGYNGAYDGSGHTIGLTVTDPATGAAITYSTEENGSYSAEEPTRKDVGTTTVWFKIDAGSNYNEATGSAAITITEASITFDITANTNYNVAVNKGTLTIKAADYALELVPDYTDGYTLVLVYTNSKPAFTYDGAAMYKLTNTTYTYNETAYANVFGLVVKGTAEDTKVTAVAGTPAGTLDCGTLNVNREAGVTFSDVLAVQAVSNANEDFIQKYMDIALKADVNHDKKVDADDFGAVKQAYLNTL